MKASTLKNDVFTLVIILILLAVGGFYYYKDKPNFGIPKKTTPAPTIPADAKTEEITITASSFKFDPPEITVTKGTKVKIIFKNTDGEHNLTIPDLNVKTKDLKPGEQVTVEFFAAKEGTFAFHCSYGHHKEFGMTGKLVVK